jgi:hypothetical protein
MPAKLSPAEAFDLLKELSDASDLKSYSGISSKVDRAFVSARQDEGVNLQQPALSLNSVVPMPVDPTIHLLLKAVSSGLLCVAACTEDNSSSNNRSSMPADAIQCITTCSLALCWSLAQRLTGVQVVDTDKSLFPTDLAQRASTSGNVDKCFPDATAVSEIFTLSNFEKAVEQSFLQP